MKVLWEIFVPAGELGVKYPEEKHHFWDQKVKEIAGGLTIYKITKGLWVDDSNYTFRENMIPVRIMCTKEEIEKIADFTAKHYEQKAIMYYKVTDEVIIKEYDV